MAPFEKAMVVSYRLSIVTVAISVTIRLQFAMECSLWKLLPHSHSKNANSSNCSRLMGVTFDIVS